MDLEQERFRSLIPSYIRDSSVAVIVYDITSACKRPLPALRLRGASRLTLLRLTLLFYLGVWFV
jgi:GTPase SAR1 family protein